jgi:hypothetical protein
MDDLPVLSLIDRKLFQDTIRLSYSTTRESLRIKWVVRNLDFFPFLRFYQSLTRGLFHVELSPSRLHIELTTARNWMMNCMRGNSRKWKSSSNYIG